MPPPRTQPPSDDDSTARYEHGEGSRRGGSSGDIPSADMLGLLREVLRAQRQLHEDVATIKIRLERGSVALDGVSELPKQMQDHRDAIVELRTKMAGVLWVAGVAGATGIGGLVTALLGIITTGGQ